MGVMWRETCRGTPGGLLPVRSERHAGFTLVELLVVIGLISLLAGLLLPALAGVRRQARTLVSTSNMREITAAANTFASDNRGMYPPSVATIGMDDSWNWQPPNLLTGYLKRTPQVHRSVSAYLRAYIRDADIMFCPSAPMRYPYLQEVWDAADDWDHPDTEAVPDAVFGTYCLYWNYVGYLGKDVDLFRGPTGPIRGSRGSSIVVSDYLGYDQWRDPLAYGSCEQLRDAGVTDGTSLSSASWSRPGNDTAEERRDLGVTLRAGYVDGHVESYCPIDTRAMYVIKHRETSEPYEPGDGLGVFYIPRVGLR